MGTRGSVLALTQARMVRAQLMAVHGVDESEIEIIVISTSGDRLTDRPLSEAGGKGLFSKEIEEALLSGRIDVGVHSSKDMATVLPAGLCLTAFLKREDVRDAFVSLSATSLMTMPEGARVGTSSIRRAAQVLRQRPDLTIVPFRGNVDTRLRKLSDGVADATLLAVAGLNRMGAADRISEYLDPRIFPPAPAQGAIAIEIREDDMRTEAIVASLEHKDTSRRVNAERALLRVLDGSCRTAIGAFSEITLETLTLTGQILSPDGRDAFEITLAGGAGEGEATGMAVGQALLATAGPEFIARFGAA